MLSTLLAGDDDRCLRCHTTKQFHDEHPGGVRYAVLEDVAASFYNDEDEVSKSVCHNIYVCYNYVDVMSPDDMT